MKKMLCFLLITTMILSSTMFAMAEESDWAYIQEKGILTIGITLFPPMNYFDGEELVGFDTELALMVCEELGVEAEFIEINWDTKEMELNAKNIDVIWNGMCITEERAENMTFTQPYLNNTQAMVMKADLVETLMADIPSAVVAAEAGSTGEGKMLGLIPDDDTVEVSALTYFEGSTYVAVDSMAKALLEVKAGTADIALVDSVCALAAVGEGTDYPELVVNIDNNFGLQQYGIACRKGSDLAALIDECYQALLADGTVDEIAQAYGLTDMLVR